MSRSKTVRNAYDKKFETFELNEVYTKVLGTPEKVGVWIIYGPEKNGKSRHALQFAKEVSTIEPVLYVTAEEGLSKDFVDNMKRSGINPAVDKKLYFQEYLPLDMLDAKMKTRKCQRVIFIDNVTMYSDELTRKVLLQLLDDHKDKLIVFIAHEEKGEPFTSVAQLIKKLSRIIFRIKGLTAFISGRCPGGAISVHQEKAELYWGTEQFTNN
jgi:KaiC/GvpD/RAD55 family RecA-like ATPase